MEMKVTLSFIAVLVDYRDYNHECNKLVAEICLFVSFPLQIHIKSSSESSVFTTKCITCTFMKMKVT